MRRLPPVILGAALAAAALPVASIADDRPPQGEAHPTLPWLALQLLPSPGTMISRGVVNATVEWQVTPLLWAFGQRPTGARRLRAFIAEPMVRYGGSIELYYAPEYVGVSGCFASRWGVRAGVRAYLPLIQRGDNLAMSFGVSDLLLHDQQSFVVDAGMHVLYGVLGVTVGWSPDLLGAHAWLAGLRVRYF